MGRKKKGAERVEKLTEMINEELGTAEVTNFYSDMDNNALAQIKQNCEEEVASPLCGEWSPKAIGDEPMEKYLDELVSGVTPLETPLLKNGEGGCEGITENDGEAVPMMHEPKWTDYVMKQFVQGELVNGHPTAAGLRRVAELLLGTIKKSRVQIIQSPSDGNGMCAVAEYTVEIDCVLDSYGSEPRVFTAAADAHPGNTDEKFAIYPTALAETRAKGRAFREALRLSKCAAEEMYAVPEDEGEAEGKISKSQISFLDMLAARLGLDAWGFVNMGKTKYAKISDVPYETAQKMAKTLSDWQRQPEKIPEQLRGGYADDWSEKHR